MRARTSRRTALVTVGVAGGLFVLVAALMIPWRPVPGGPLEPPAPEELFTAAEIARAESYAAWARVWSWSSLALSLVVAGLFGFTRWGRRLMARLPGPWWARMVLGVAFLVLVGRLLTLPLGLALRQHRLDNGLTSQSLGGYLSDVILSQVVTIVVTSLALAVLIGGARRWRRHWPAVVGGLLGALVLVASFAYPVVIEPLFNDFEPLAEGELRSSILEVAETEGVEVREVLVADASRRTTTLNAYVSGFAGTRRVVLYDNLVDDLPRDQALSVVAHELAHARHNDVLVGSVLGGLGAALAVGLLGLMIGSPRVRHLAPDELRTAAAVPLVMALLAVGTLVSSPVQAGISRQVELRADRDALEATGDADGFVEMQLQLARRSLSDPTPPAWSHFWFGSHPTTLQRVALAERLRH
ncbi:M48 family metallopeptidase [Nocardioides sp.]|uniref:M48 family metallopeptidase n=1 Tax=Nocardioides sp. TaxID=35761 RepID=UPI00273406B7|nr:M48 family metallopeptidase [Nocardioides sp.]MDP3894126.1 M48 family metallopeptidase [Nocardioides sp.]